MSKPNHSDKKGFPRSRISEAVWATVIGIAATHAQAAEEAAELHKSDMLNEEEFKEDKDKSALVAAGGAGAGSNENILGDGTTVAHAGDAEGVVQEEQAPELAQNATVPANDANSVEADKVSAIKTAAQASTAGDAVAESGLAAVGGAEQSVFTGDAVIDAAEGDGVDTDYGSAPLVAGMEFDTGLLAALGVGAVAVGALIVASDDDDDNNSGSTGEPLSGTAIDGYIAGATVWADLNGDGVQDAGETTVTDSNGNFSFGSVAAGTTVSILPGGRDVMTGEIVNTTLTATASSAGEVVVSPITTLLAQGANEAELREALGLPDDVDLATFDPVAAITSDDPAVRAAGESVFTAAQQVMTVLQTGAASGQTVQDVATSLANSINSGATLEAATVTTLGSDLGGVVNNVNQAIESSLGNGQLATAINSGSFQQLSDTMDVVAIAQTQLVNSVEQATQSGGTVNADDWTPEAIGQAAEQWTPDLNEDNFAFLVEQGLSLEGADVQITDEAFLQTLINDPTAAGALSGADLEVDDSLSEFTDTLAGLTGNDVAVGDLGDY